jgi:phenylpyruvate tautomerase PptA (4-oxalocrotonate tautomerase family)
VPLYTAITQEGSVSDETKAKIAQEITRIHTSLMKSGNAMEMGQTMPGVGQQ